MFFVDVKFYPKISLENPNFCNNDEERGRLVPLDLDNECMLLTDRFSAAIQVTPLCESSVSSFKAFRIGHH